MLSIKQLKFLKSLQQRKFRQKYGKFLAEGVKTGEEIIMHGRSFIEGIYATDDWLAEHGEFIGTLPPERVHMVTEKELKSVSLLKTPNQVLFVMNQPDSDLTDTKIGNGLSLYLDEIRDPGNMGTILRIADWFGIRWVFCSAGCVEVFNPKVIQSSMGAFLRIRTATVSLEDLKKRAPEVSVLGMALDGVSVYEAQLPTASVVVIGNESKGISDLNANLIDQRIAIPRHPEGGAESLNAAIATGIICSLIRRQENR